MKNVLYLVCICLLYSCTNTSKPTNNVASVPVTVDVSDKSVSDHSQVETSNTQGTDSVNDLNAGPDENGIYQGFPEEYKAQNKAEEKLAESLKDYYISLRDANGNAASDYIAPKMIDIAQVEFPDMSRNQIKTELVSILVGLSKEMKDTFKNTFEGYETTIAVPTDMKMISINGSNIVYSLEYAMVVLCKYDDNNYVSWYLKNDLYAGSKNNGTSWYLIEPEMNYKEILADFK